MRIASALLLVLALAVPPAEAWDDGTSAPAPEDAAGWRSTAWGMTVEQAQAALGSEAVVVSEEEARSPNLAFQKGGLVTRLMIPDYEAAGSRFLVRLGFNEKGLQVVALSIKEWPRREIGEVEFDALERALTEKYGAPSRIGDRRELFRQTTWALRSMVITLGFASPVPDTAFVNLTYEPRGNDRL